jgi:hypothetical protein
VLARCDFFGLLRKIFAAVAQWVSLQATISRKILAAKVWAKPDHLC